MVLFNKFGISENEKKTVSKPKLGPYLIIDAMKEKHTYILKKLNGLRLAVTFAGDRLKKFHPQERLHLNHISNLDFDELSNLDNFFFSNGNSNFSNVSDDISDL